MDVMLLHPRGRDLVGYIPYWLSEHNPASAREQLHKGYSHGGGWSPFQGFTMNKETFVMQYPGDPPTRPVAYMRLREETIVVYEHAWVAVVQADGKFEVCRMD